MHYGVELEDYNALWQRAIRQEDGSYSPRTESDEEEKKFWSSFMGSKKTYEPDPYSRPIAAFVTELLRQYNISSVLEIGPGWGNYTVPMAKACRDMTCVDISPDVLAYIRRIADIEGISTIQTICSKWEDGESAVRRDAVFAYNCFYRMRDLRECLRKINDSADKLCIIGMTSGPEQPFLKDYELELGLNIRYDRLDYIYLTNILYSLGIDVNCRIIPLEKEYAYDTREEMLSRETGRIRDEAYDHEKADEILDRYFHMENGKYRFVHQFKAAVLYWEK